MSKLGKQKKLPYSQIEKMDDMFITIIRHHIRENGLKMDRGIWKNRYRKLFPGSKDAQWENMVTAIENPSKTSMTFSTFGKWLKILDIEMDVRLSSDEFNERSYIQESRDLSDKIIPMEAYIHSVISAISDIELTANDMVAIYRAAHSKLLEHLILRWDLPEEELTEEYVKNLLRTVVHTQAKYIAAAQGRKETLK